MALQRSIERPRKPRQMDRTPLWHLLLSECVKGYPATELIPMTCERAQGKVRSTLARFHIATVLGASFTSITFTTEGTLACTTHQHYLFRGLITRLRDKTAGSYSGHSVTSS